MRKTKEITIDDRGTAKTFRITEMPATKFEWWIIQAGRALLGAGLGKEEREGETQRIKVFLRGDVGCCVHQFQFCHF